LNLAINHREEALTINKEEFIKTIKNRRSVRVYNKEQVKEEDMRHCLELALLAPNSSNLQPWEFYWVRTENKKNKLIEYCLGQPAAATAKELVSRSGPTRLLENKSAKNASND
jgi:nitroreductase